MMTTSLEQNALASTSEEDMENHLQNHFDAVSKNNLEIHSDYKHVKMNPHCKSIISFLQVASMYDNQNEAGAALLESSGLVTTTTFQEGTNTLIKIRLMNH